MEKNWRENCSVLEEEGGFLLRSARTDYSHTEEFQSQPMNIEGSLGLPLEKQSALQRHRSR